MIHNYISKSTNVHNDAQNTNQMHVINID